MGYDHSRIKSNARLFYKNNMWYSIAVVVILLVIPGAATSLISGAGGAISAVIAAVTGIAVGDGASEGAGWAMLVILTALVYIVYTAVSLVVGAATYILLMGVQNWFRKSIYGQTPVEEVFTPFRKQYFWGSAAAVGLMYLYIFLWSLLFIIPGLIKTYSYAQTLFIKAENPNIPASRAIELSKIMMDGHKFDLFYLHLSFIGWLILSAFTLNILGIVYVFPYYYAALAFAYEEIKVDAASRGLFDIREIQPDYAA